MHIILTRFQKFIYADYCCDWYKDNPRNPGEAAVNAEWDTREPWIHIHTYGHLSFTTHLLACFWELGGKQRTRGKHTMTYTDRSFSSGLICEPWNCCTIMPPMDSWIVLLYGCKIFRLKISLHIISKSQKEKAKCCGLEQLWIFWLRCCSQRLSTVTFPRSKLFFFLLKWSGSLQSSVLLPKALCQTCYAFSRHFRLHFKCNLKICTFLIRFFSLLHPQCERILLEFFVSTLYRTHFNCLCNSSCCYDCTMFTA